MKVTDSVKVLLVAGMAMQATTGYAKATEQNDIEQQHQAASSSTSLQEESLEETLAEQGTLESLEEENAALDAMLNEVTELEAPVESDIETTLPTEDTLSESTPAQVDIEPLTAEEAFNDVTDIDESVIETSEPYSAAPENSYSFNRATNEEGNIYLPVTADAKVFAEFITELPAVVNYYTKESEESVISFYSDSFGEPIMQERKRERLTLSYSVDGIATRVIISQQDEHRQVDVIQANPM